ncbi:hypothetical protein ABBQ32_012165 [Trebouxia sp. C0010 RCD-2024]
MGNLSESITAFTTPVNVDIKIVQVGGFGQQSFQLALTRTLLQVDSVLLNTDVTFPNTAGIQAAAAAAAQLTSTLSSNPGQVYTASATALLASAVVEISSITQTSSLPVAVPPSQIPPGPVPVQFLLTEDLSCDPTCVASPAGSRKLLGTESSPQGVLAQALYDKWQALVNRHAHGGRRRRLVDRPCCTSSTQGGAASPGASAAGKGKSSGIVIGIGVAVAATVLGLLYLGYHFGACAKLLHGNVYRSASEVVPWPQHTPTGPRPGPSYMFRPTQNPELYLKRHPPVGSMGQGPPRLSGQDLPCLVRA